jgi:hypothetical protein
MRLENVTFFSKTDNIEIWKCNFFFSKTDNIEIWKCNLKKKERPYWDLKMQLFFQTQTILRLENVAFFSKTDNHETWKCNFLFRIGSKSLLTGHGT